jgi:LacI family purine nucleotide synthesis repressor
MWILFNQYIRKNDYAYNVLINEVMQQMSKPTIKDVAREAGVSIGTVSNALNGTRYINEKTKQKVINAVDKLHYIPNMYGKYLKSGATKMFGFFTNSIAGPYFGILVDSMARQCGRMGYHLAIYVTREADVILGNLMGQRLDGVLIYEDTTVRETEIKMLQNEGIKAVFLDREVMKPGISSVLFDSYQAGYEAARYLISLGHRQLAFIECVDEVIDSLRRKEGMLAAVREAGMKEAEVLILQGAFEKEFTYNAVRRFLRNHTGLLPDAFLAGNDLSAMGCIEALTMEGLQVPGDISVMGFDDIDLAEYYTPPLTTVRNPIGMQGILAVKTLVGLIDGQEEGQIKRLEGTLTIRKSCNPRLMQR